VSFLWLDGCQFSQQQIEHRPVKHEKTNLRHMLPDWYPRQTLGKGFYQLREQQRQERHQEYAARRAQEDESDEGF
jgi:hypothetical protein